MVERVGAAQPGGRATLIATPSAVRRAVRPVLDELVAIRWPHRHIQDSAGLGGERQGARCSRRLRIVREEARSLKAREMTPQGRVMEGDSGLVTDPDGGGQRGEEEHGGAWV